MRAAKNDGAGAVPQQCPKQPVHILLPSPKRHGLAQRTRPKGSSREFRIDELELCYAGDAGEGCLADRRQESNHRVVVVNPPDIQEEDNVWPTTFHTFGYIVVHPVIEDWEWGGVAKIVQIL